jgi:hypothetical protein
MTNQDDSSEHSRNRPQFAHPAEAEFARLLDYYGLEWRYEPRTFPLDWDEDGNVILAFSPDFYLPDEDTYVELTTLRPTLSTHKNRKMHLMAELYPDVRIKLYNRSAIHRLLVKYGLDEQAAKIRGSGARNWQA